MFTGVFEILSNIFNNFFDDNENIEKDVKMQCSIDEQNKRKEFLKKIKEQAEDVEYEEIFD